MRTVEFCMHHGFGFMGNEPILTTAAVPLESLLIGLSTARSASSGQVGNTSAKMTWLRWLILRGGSASHRVDN